MKPKTPLEEPRDLKFYENNAQEDFASTPISVLRYISELEEKVKGTEQIAIGFSKWKNGLTFAAQWESAGTTQARLKNDSELFKDYMEILKP